MNKNKRIERDFISEAELDKDILYGIHSFRARENFPDETPFQIEWYKAIGLVKLACYMTCREYKKAIKSKYGSREMPVRLPGDDTIEKMMEVAEEISAGKYFEHFIVPAISGGAGTSINMNVNEIIANAALKKLGKEAGDYTKVDPIEDANIFQSTNDVIPSSLKVAAMRLLNELEENINSLRLKTEEFEKNNRNNLRIAYTQMQEAVPSSYGRLFSTYNEALSRDWWRVSKCFERIKVINLGGSAVGTGITVPRYFIMEAARNLQKLTNLSVTRSENLSDATNNFDSFVEVHAILKAHAVNLEKMVSDLRLLSSNIIKNHEVSLPKKQTGSSIMPGKVNPVIPEYIVSVAHKVYSNDMLISSLCAQGCLDLNAYLPVIGHALLESIKLLTGACKTLRYNLFEGLAIDHKIAYENLLNSSSITAALLPYIGYNSAEKLAREMNEKNTDIFTANKNLKLIPENKLKKILEPQNLLKEGYSAGEIIDN